MKTLLTLLLALVGATAAAQPVHPVILVSMDGFRPDYLERGVTPNLNRLVAGGARAVGMRPSFPSITFPNHYTLVTGLRPDHHGLVDNVISDPSISQDRFTLSNAAAVTDHRWWDQAEPVWVTAERSGVRTATMFWPGSEAAIHGVRPTIAPKFDGDLPAAQRVDTLLSWLDQPQQQFGFLTLYFDDVDHAGHSFGPAADETTQAVALVDQAIGRLVDGLAARHIAANIVIVSDHGMAAVSKQRVIRLQDLVPKGSYEDVVSGPYAAVNPQPGKEAELAAALLQPHEHLQCWRKQEIPARLVYGSNARVPAFLCLADTGWSVVFSDKSAAKVKGGKHGYDNSAPEMAATFIANGPAFKPGVVVPTFDNVDVYPLLMRLLDVTPLPNDGDITPLLPVLGQE